MREIYLVFEHITKLILLINYYLLFIVKIIYKNFMTMPSNLACFLLCNFIYKMAFSRFYEFKMFLLYEYTVFVTLMVTTEILYKDHCFYFNKF